MVPVALAVVGDVYPEGKRARALGTLGAIETMGWVWGPLYGAMLVRFLSWQWQFWLNIPLRDRRAGRVVVGARGPRPTRAATAAIDWLGAALLTVALVSLNVALLGSAEIQSVNGLDELTGGAAPTGGGCTPSRVVAGVGFVVQQRRSPTPAVRPAAVPRPQSAGRAVRQLRGRRRARDRHGRRAAVHQLRRDRPRTSGRRTPAAILSALTAAMAIMSYVGGRVDGTLVVPAAGARRRWRCRPRPTPGWARPGPPTPRYPVFAVQLALLGGGFGLTVAPDHERRRRRRAGRPARRRGVDRDGRPTAWGSASACPH